MSHSDFSAIQKGYSLHQTAYIELLSAKIVSRVWDVARLKNKKQKKSQDPDMLPPLAVSTANWIRTKFGRAGDLPNVITHAKSEVNWYKIVTYRLSPTGLANCRNRFLSLAVIVYI